MKKISVAILFCFCLLILSTKLVHAQFGPNLNLLYAQPSSSLYVTKPGDLNIGLGYGTHALIEAAYSPVKHISIQANYLHYPKKLSIAGDEIEIFDNIARLSIGGYYFMPLKRLRNRKEKIKSKFGMDRGLLFDANFGYGLGSKSATSNNISHQSNFNLFNAEMGIHYFGKILSLHFSINRSLFSFYNYKVNGAAPDPFLDVGDLLIEDKSFDIFSFNQRISIGPKQMRFYIATNTPLINKGDVSYIIDQTSETLVSVETIAGIIINVNSLLKKDFSYKKKLFQKQ